MLLAKCWSYIAHGSSTSMNISCHAGASRQRLGVNALMTVEEFQSEVTIHLLLDVFQ